MVFSEYFDFTFDLNLLEIYKYIEFFSVVSYTFNISTMMPDYKLFLIDINKYVSSSYVGNQCFQEKKKKLNDKFNS